MNRIEFSHTYNKFPRDYKISKLLEVFNIKLEDLSLDFILYDTTYRVESGQKDLFGRDVEYAQYPLPEKGDYMILLLQAGSGKGQLWTTIRRRTLAKEMYYRSIIGQEVECVVTT